VISHGYFKKVVEFYVALNCENLPRQLVLSIELSDDIWWYGFRPSGTAIPVRVLRLQRRLEDPVNPRKIAFPSSFPLAPMLFLVGPRKLDSKGALAMEWVTPQHEEIDLNCEISSYANAEL